MDLGLRDRHVVVTGGSSGLGLATARVLVDEGARVTLVARDEGRLADAVAELGPQAQAVAADITGADASATIIGLAVEQRGAIDGLVVSHGGPPPGTAAGLADDVLDAAIDVAVRGPVRLVRDVAATMRADGSIVLITSTSTSQPIPGLAASNVTRPAVWGFAKTLADEVGPAGVRVNVVLPGSFDTDRLRQYEDAVATRTGATRAQVRADAARRIPLRRIGDADELGRVIAFLVSPAASYVTGAAWAVDGGMLRGL